MPLPSTLAPLVKPPNPLIEAWRKAGVDKSVAEKIVRATQGVIANPELPIGADQAGRDAYFLALGGYHMLRDLFEYATANKE